MSVELTAEAAWNALNLLTLPILIERMDDRKRLSSSRHRVES